MTENINFKVSVRCMTYNQAVYIEDAMNGFCMQQTDFPFVCNVMDDASTDGEQDVIRKYLDEHFDLDEKNLIKKEETDDYKLILARHKKNINCYFAVYFLKYNHYNSPQNKKRKLQYISAEESKAKYIAFCEGDDYWTNLEKLQKQIDFLENNKEYGMCFTDFDVYIQNRAILKKSVLKNYPDIFPTNYNLDDWIVKKKYLGPMTWCVRREIWLNAPNFKSVDLTFVWFAYFLSSTKIKCLREETTAVYRLHAGGVTHQLKLAKQYQRHNGMFKTQMKLLDLFKDHLENYYKTKQTVEKDYYSNFFLLLSNKNEEEILEAVDFFGEDFAFKHKLMYALSKTSFGLNVMTVFVQGGVYVNHYLRCIYGYLNKKL